MSYFSFEKEISNYIEGVRAQLLARPLNLGGVTGAGGGTGYVGYLPQTRVVYDPIESGTLSTAVSGSLLDNLNHIRYRIAALEAGGVGGGSITVLEDGVEIDADVTHVDFVDASVSQVSPGHITVTVGSGVASGNADLNDLTDVTITSPVDGQLLQYNSTTSGWENATIEGLAPPVSMALFTIASGLYILDNPLRVYNVMGTTKVISRVFLSVATAPSGQAIIVDIHKNGTTIFTTQSNRPQISAGNNTGFTTTIEVSGWTDGEYLTSHIDQVGTPVAGSDLTIHIVYS